MSKYQMLGVQRAIEAVRNGECGHGRQVKKRPARRRKMILLRRVCNTCGRTLSRYDNLKNYAYCYSCRRILFPETTMTRAEWHRLNGIRGGSKLDSRVSR